MCSDSDVDQYFSKPFASGNQVPVLALYSQVLLLICLLYLTTLSLALRRIILMKNELKICGRHWSWSIGRLYSDTSPERISKTTKILIRYSRYPAKIRKELLWNKSEDRYGLSDLARLLRI